MSKLITFLCVLASMICIVSCGNQVPQNLEEEPAKDQLIGRVSSIYQKQNYLLVQKYRRFETSENAIFYTRHEDGSTHSIKMTGQRLGQFYVADIEGGQFCINDPVFMRDLSQKVLKPAGTTEAKESEPHSEAPQATPTE